MIEIKRAETIKHRMCHSSDLHYRQAVEADIERVVDIHRSAIIELGAEFYTERQIEAWAAEAMPEIYPTNDPSVLLLLVEDKDAILGIGQLNIDEPEIAKLFIAPEAAGNGIGGQLLHRLETHAIDRGIDELFLDSSLNATDFYHRNGYNYGTMLNKHLATDDGDEVVYPTLRMWKSLSD